MRRIAIAAVKGGTGRTTTAVTVAHALVLAGARVLVVDCDPRRHAALYFGLQPERGLRALLQGGRARAIEVRRGLRLLDSGGLALERLEANLSEWSRGEDKLRRVLASLDDADYVLFDCPAHFGPLQRGAVQTADEVLLPVGADHLSRLGIQPALEAVIALRGEAETRRPARLVLTFASAADASARDVESRLCAEFPSRLLQTRIRTSESLRAAPGGQGTVFDADPLSMGAHDYAFLAEEIASLAA